MSFTARCKVFVMALALAAALVTAVHAQRAARTQGGVIRTHAGALRYEVYLPADYATSGRRYPVLYFLHGLPAGTYAFKSFTWLEHAPDATQLQAILVLPQRALGKKVGSED